MNTILDEGMTRANLIEIRKKLIANGLTRTYGNEHEVVVEESDSVKVKLKKSPVNRQLLVEGKTPPLGNPVQILATIIALAIFLLTGAPLGLIWAVLVGWAISFFYYRSKISQLKEKVWLIIHQK
ncbi:MAG: hypothetical protein OHK0019_31570 [Saprospiraceae bacterium]